MSERLDGTEDLISQVDDFRQGPASLGGGAVGSGAGGVAGSGGGLVLLPNERGDDVGDDLQEGDDAQADHDRHQEVVVREPVSAGATDLESGIGAGKK